MFGIQFLHLEFGQVIKKKNEKPQNQYSIKQKVL